MNTIPLLRNSCLGLALLASAGLGFNPTSTQAADTWLTVDQPGFDGWVNGLAWDAVHNTLFAVGDNDWALATVRKSTDGGITWTTADSFTHQGSSWTSYNSVAVDPSGVVHAAGESGGVWFIRRSSDGGATWTTTDLFTYPNASSASPHAVAVAADGSVYVAGTASVQVRKNGARQLRWIVRRTTNGTTWSTVDDYADSGGAFAKGITVSGGNIYVVGLGVSSGNYWLVRKGVPNGSGGVGWQTIDAYRLVAGTSSWAEAISADAAGNLFVAGQGESWETIPGTGTGKNSKPQNVLRDNWVVRKLSVGGTWQTIDVYHPITDYDYEPQDIAVAANGTVWVTGSARNHATLVSTWLTRKLDGTGQWSISDAVPTSSGFGLVTDAAGTVFIGGTSDRWLWTIRGLVSE